MVPSRYSNKLLLYLLRNLLEQALMNYSILLDGCVSIEDYELILEALFEHSRLSLLQRDGSAGAVAPKFMELHREVHI